VIVSIGPAGQEELDELDHTVRAHLDDPHPSEPCSAKPCRITPGVSKHRARSGRHATPISAKRSLARLTGTRGGTAFLHADLRAGQANPRRNYLRAGLGARLAAEGSSWPDRGT
jgi:hypothetical protein